MNNGSKIYIVAGPIGNLKDITFRALEALKESELILAEDTRVTKKLIGHYGIDKEIISYHHHSNQYKIKKIIEFLKDEKKIALISDAGTPGISDPGNILIAEIIKVFGNSVKIIPIPGPSAVSAALSISGFNTDRFLFLGFIPTKKKRKAFLSQIVNSSYPVIFFESPYRVLKTLAEIKQEAENKKQKTMAVVCRELTKKFETVYRGEIAKVIDDLKKSQIKGEFTVIIKNI